MAIDGCIVNGYNLTAQDCQAIFSPPGVIQSALNNPLFWVLMIVVVIVFAFMMMRPKQKGDPSTKPMFGYFFRLEWMKKLTDKKFKTWGEKVKLHMMRGGAKIGITDRYHYEEHILYDKVITNPRTREMEFKAKGVVTADTYRFRKYGFVAWLKAAFGYGMEYITLTPDAYQIVPGNNYKKFFLIVEPAATLLNDSGIWTFNDKRLIDHNYETILKVDDENIHGFQIDMLRRLSVHQAQTATALEKMSHESGLKEKERKARNSPYE